MKITKKVEYTNSNNDRCAAIQFEDGSVAIHGREEFIIEGAENALLRADEILSNKGYKVSPNSSQQP